MNKKFEKTKNNSLQIKNNRVVVKKKINYYNQMLFS